MALREAAEVDATRLRQAVKASVSEATRTAAPRVLAVGLPLASCDPLGGFARFGAEDRFFWEQAGRDISLAGRGAVVTLEAEAPEGVADAGPIARVGAAAAKHFRRVDRVGAAAPLFVGGFAFDGRTSGSGDWERFPAGRMELPELLLRRQGGRTLATLCAEIPSGADPDPLFERLEAEIAAVRRLAGVAAEDRESLEALCPPRSDAGAEYRVVADRGHGVFRGQVDSALSAIEAGDLEKVVLARSLEVFHPGRFAVPSFLHELRVLYPHCTVLACGRGEDTLVAASPELLVSLQQGAVESCALAGSAARGRSPEEDARLGKALRESPKERAEHAAVVRAVRDGLARWVDELRGPEAPELMRVLGIQHLATPLRGRLLPECKETGVLDLVACLHPTPAVAGLERNASLDWIARREGLDRGWYAGPIGWLDADGDGEFWLALRSALIRNAPAADCAGPSRARLFAGAGIVAGSRPEAELRETRLKLRALLAPLTEI